MAKYSVLFSLRRSSSFIYADSIITASRRAHALCKLFNKNISEEHKNLGWTMEVFSIKPEKKEKLIVEG